ncbi:geranylgeranyl transferase type-1 subunit beta [Sarcoptes scabiei]|nr:geranylgeranyl transferase type-1 subunit beta [Sarcoptes scabiei]
MSFVEKSKGKFAKYLIKHLSYAKQSTETFRLTILFYVLSGLDLLDALDELDCEQKSIIIEWIYKQQIHPEEQNDELFYQNGHYGFGPISASEPNFKYNQCNLAMTYCALASLIILGDDLSRINRRAILKGLSQHQKDDGRFVQALIEEEDDIRMTYCAACICSILDDWSSINKSSMISNILSCLSYENGFGQKPGTEAQGGSTFCAIASLHLIDQLKSLTEDQKSKITEWCLRRQTEGFSGRTGKKDDTCYSFWVGATLTLLNSFIFINDKKNSEFIQSTYASDIGGFAKFPYTGPDLMHTFFGLSTLSLRIIDNFSASTTPTNENENNAKLQMQPIFPGLIISKRAYDHLKSIQQNFN